MPHAIKTINQASSLPNSAKRSLVVQGRIATKAIAIPILPSLLDKGPFFCPTSATAEVAFIHKSIMAPQRFRACLLHPMINYTFINSQSWSWQVPSYTRYHSMKFHLALSSIIQILPSHSYGFLVLSTIFGAFIIPLSQKPFENKKIPRYTFSYTGG